MITSSGSPLQIPGSRTSALRRELPHFATWNHATGFTDATSSGAPFAAGDTEDAEPPFSASRCCRCPSKRPELAPASAMSSAVAVTSSLSLLHVASPRRPHSPLAVLLSKQSAEASKCT